MTSYPTLQREREIWQVCDDLIALGKSVREITGEAISWRLRELKYKAGSKTYIYKYRDSWMTARGLSREEQGSFNTAELSDPIARATAIFKEGLQRELEREYEQKYTQMQTQLLEREQHIALLEETTQQLQQQQIEQQQQYTILAERYELQSKDRLIMHEEAISHKMMIAQLEKQLAEACSHYEQAIQQSNKQQEVLEMQYKTSLTELHERSRDHLNEIKINYEKQNHWLTEEIEVLKTKLEKNNTINVQLEIHNAELKMQIQFLEKTYAIIQSFDEKIQDLNPSLQNITKQLGFIRIQQENGMSNSLTHQTDLHTSLLQIIDTQLIFEKKSLQLKEMIEKLIMSNAKMELEPK